MMKFQFMSNIGKNQHDVNGIWPMLCQCIIMSCISLFEEIAKNIPKIISDFKTIFVNNCKKKIDQTIENRKKPLIETSVPLIERHFINSFVMTRIFTDNDESTNNNNNNNNNESNIMVDALLEIISKLDNIPSFQLIDNLHTIINYKDKPIQLNKDIFVKIDNITLSPKGSVTSLKLSLLSNTVSASELTFYVKSIYNNYLETMKNSLGDNIYFFDQKSRDNNEQPPVSNNPQDIINYKRMKISTANKQLYFTKTKFFSNKQFSNIYGDEIRLIEKRVRFFIENKNWYNSKGIPYQLGLLLSGLPGAGKTSVIKAIANLTKRHIINVNFANITTATQLKNLFYNEKINTYTDVNMSTNHSYFIPIDQRLYVLEELDAIGDIVKQRTDINNIEPTVNDELTLMEILTVLDGTQEIPGRIVIMTTNHPEILDKALIRPGRIDVNVKFSYATRDLILEMYEAYFDKPFNYNYYDKLPDKILSPAEVGQVLFKYFDTDCNEEIIINDLIITKNSKNKLNLENEKLNLENEKNLENKELNLTNEKENEKNLENEKLNLINEKLNLENEKLNLKNEKNLENEKLNLINEKLNLKNEKNLKNDKLNLENKEFNLINEEFDYKKINLEKGFNLENDPFKRKIYIK